jgi:hypothetical protein
MRENGLIINGGIKIDRNVDMPDKRDGAGRKYPWVEMKIGDSFLFPAHVTAPHSMAIHAARRYERKFSVRKTAEGYRCWRVE